MGERKRTTTSSKAPRSEPSDTIVALLEGVSEGVCLTDLDGRIAQVNTAAEILTGRSSAQMVGRTCGEAFGCADGEGAAGATVPTDRYWDESSCQGSRADGRPLSLRFRTRYLRDAAGRLTGRIVLFWESSVQEGLEKRVFAYQRLASLGEMTSSLVHEVGNPVSIIVGFARLLVQQGGEDPGGEIRDRIYREAVRCGRIVEQFLSYARDSSRAPRPGPLGLKQVLEETLELLSYRLKQRGAEIEVAWQADVPLVLADAGEIKQVLLNIILNSIEAMERGGTVRISGRLLVKHRTVGGDSLLRPKVELVEERWAEVAVEDEGPGLGPADPERLFVPFFTTKAKGGGLGLSVCRRLLRERGGVVRLENREGGGARAVLELPAYAPTRGL